MVFTPFRSSIGWDKIRTLDLLVMNLVCYPLDQAFAHFPYISLLFKLLPSPPMNKLLFWLRWPKRASVFYVPRKKALSNAKSGMTVSCFTHNIFSLKGHSNNGWHFLAYLRPPSPMCHLGVQNLEKMSRDTLTTPLPPPCGIWWHCPVPLPPPPESVTYYLNGP